MKRMGRWLEDEVFSAAGKAGEETPFLSVHLGGRVCLQLQATDESPSTGGCREPCDLLGRLGVRRIRVGTRLESNQIEDLLTLLYACRQDEVSRHRSGRPRDIVRQLQSREGLHFSCMQVRLRDHLLVVQYSYWVTWLSLTARWLERRRHALFHAAPHYGLLTVALTVAVLVGFLLTGSLAFLVAATTQPQAPWLESLTVRQIGSVS